jgi:protein-disulfide reductase (glutathione)
MPFMTPTTLTRVSRRAALLMAAAVLASPLAFAKSPDGASNWNGSEIAWHDMRTGVMEATKSGKTAIMVMHAEWCSACKKYRNVFADPAIVASSKDYIMILIDVDKDPTTNGAFSPDGTYVPRTLFITPDGDVRKDLVGKTDPEHPHTIDNKSPDELLGLMRKGVPGGSGVPPQEQTMLID